ncbi:MAG TPA: Ig-like domain-containing protein, partial [Archangium sp.]|nr:Ig-like domain-containing protein [Archangium sp.]
TGSLATARAWHTATLLPSGKVLVVGGPGPGSASLASVEVYEPATGAWSGSPTANMATARARHTATLLPSGQVLVAGGWAPTEGSSASAEVGDAELPTAVLVTPLQGSTTPDNQPTYDGTAEADSIVTLFVDGMGVGTTQANASGAWSFRQPVALRDGSHTVRARATNAVGRTSPDSNTHTFTVDTLPPAAPVLTFPANGAWSNDNRPVYAGTAEADHTVTVFVDGREVDTTTANAAGEWGFRQPEGLAEGSHTVSGRAKDALGHTSPDSNVITFTVDTLAPDAPEMSVPEILTPQQPVIIVGTAEPHSTVTVWLDGAVARTIQADETGRWVFTPTSALPEGGHQLKATAEDAAGNESPFSKDHAFTLLRKRSFYSSGCSASPPLSPSWALLALALYLGRRHRRHR